MIDQQTIDAVLIAMLENPEHADQIAAWAADPANANEISTFVDDAHGHHHGGDGRFASGSGGGGGASHDHPDHPDAKTQTPAASSQTAPSGGKSKFGKLLAKAASIPAAIKDKAAGFISKTYAKLQAKYGSAGAKLVLGGMIALLPVPVPGTSVLPIALAEGIKRLRSVVGFSESSDAGSTAADLSGMDLDAAANEALAELYADMGEPLPANLDTGDASAETAAFTESDSEGGPGSGPTFPAGDSTDGQ